MQPGDALRRPQIFRRSCASAKRLFVVITMEDRRVLSLLGQRTQVQQEHPLHRDSGSVIRGTEHINIVYYPSVLGGDHRPEAADRTPMRVHGNFHHDMSISRSGGFPAPSGM